MVIIMASIDLKTPLENLELSLKNCKAKIIEKGGTIADNAGFADLPAAIETVAGITLTVPEPVSYGTYISWSSVPNADYYEVFKNNQIDSRRSITITSSSIYIDDLGTTYCVRAASENGLFSDFSSSVKRSANKEDFTFYLLGDYDELRSRTIDPSYLEVIYTPNNGELQKSTIELKVEYNTSSSSTSTIANASASTDLFECNFVVGSSAIIENSIAKNNETLIGYTKKWTCFGNFAFFANGTYSIQGCSNSDGVQSLGTTCSTQFVVSGNEITSAET
jgi:hypothetical protein